MLIQNSTGWFRHFKNFICFLGGLKWASGRGVARIFLKGVLNLVSLARPFLQLVRCIVLTSLASLEI